ncbi:MAG: NAD(P)-dependent oxidoreductase [Treponema sp.]|nr:NAD(P)-dependent oxidoreductase [Treponema sp.]
MNKIVITGATGMIGAALARNAIKNNMTILCLINKYSNRINNIPKSKLLNIEYCSIDEYNSININSKYDAFYHLAWEKTHGPSRDDTDIQIKNIQYTIDAVNLAKRIGCEKFIGIGSQAEYGIVNDNLMHDTNINPKSSYGIAKYAAGKLSGNLCSRVDLKFNWVRILSVFGQLDGLHTLIMYAINELKEGRSPELTKCEQIWDYLYCDDAARALISIGKYGKNEKVYPLGSGNKKRLSDYIEIIKNIIDPNIILKYGEKEYYPHQPMYLCADISELTKDTGWKPEITFEEGIKKIIENIDL